MTCNSGRTKNLDGSPNERSLNVDPAAIIDGENRHSLSHACCSGLTFCRWRHLFPDLTGCVLMNLHGCRAQIGGFQILKIGSSSHLLGRSQPHRGKHHLQVKRSAILTFQFYIHAKHSVMYHLEQKIKMHCWPYLSQNLPQNLLHQWTMSLVSIGENLWKKSQTFSNVRFGFLELHSVMIFSFFSHTFVLLEI